MTGKHDNCFSDACFEYINHFELYKPEHAKECDRLIAFLANLNLHVKKLLFVCMQSEQAAIYDRDPKSPDLLQKSMIYWKYHGSDHNLFYAIWEMIHLSLMLGHVNLFDHEIAWDDICAMHGENIEKENVHLKAIFMMAFSLLLNKCY